MTQKVLSDEQLIHEILVNRRKELFGKLYDRYADKVYRKCISFVHDTDIAQDMVQDVFMKVFLKLDRFKGKSSFSTWLYSITYNHCVEYYRKNSKYTHIDIDEGVDLPLDDDAYEKELLSLRVQELKSALDQISPEDKRLLLLKYQDGLHVKEIMDMLEISESAVKMRLSRARSRVQEVIENKGKRKRKRTNMPMHMILFML